MVRLLLRNSSRDLQQIFHLLPCTLYFVNNAIAVYFPIYGASTALNKLNAYKQALEAAAVVEGKARELKALVQSFEVTVAMITCRGDTNQVKTMVGDDRQKYLDEA